MKQAYFFRVQAAMEFSWVQWETTRLFGGFEKREEKKVKNIKKGAKNEIFIDFWPNQKSECVCCSLGSTAADPACC